MMKMGGSDTVTMLAIDDHGLPLKKNLCYYLSKPEVRGEPVLTPRRDDPSAPDCVASHFYGTVLDEDGRFRMWYYAIGLQEGQDETHQGPMCYAESDDGTHWRRPNLGQVQYRGSSNNNIIGLPEMRRANPRTEGVTLIRDDEDPHPERRYKLVYNVHPLDREFFTIRTATSPDGLNWSAGPELPIDAFVEQASFYKHNGLYIVNAQTLGPPNPGERGGQAAWQWSEGGHRMGRQGFAWLSPDFDTWLEESVQSFALPEPRDPLQRGHDKPYDQVHLGVGAASFGNVLVGLYGMWHNRPTEDDWFGRTRTYADLGLVVSNDGVHFREPVKGHIFLSTEESRVTPAEGKSYPTILCQSNGILNTGDETRIYHGRWRNAAGLDYYGEVALATLPRDRWGALGLFADETKGSVWSAPVVLPSEGEFTITLNADGADGMRVEISDERFGLVPSFSGENSGTTNLDGGLECPVAWATADVRALAGERVRLRIHLTKQGDREPRLYAVYVRAPEPDRG